MNNNIYFCNIHEDVERFNKQFQHSILPSNTFLSINNIPTSTRNDNTVYNRSNETIKPLKDTINVNTRPLNYCNNINQETILHCSVIKNNNCNYNNYIPSTNSDLYTLNVPYQREHNKHDLLFNIPKYSSSCTPPVVNNLEAFNNHTRELRNKL